MAKKYALHVGNVAAAIVMEQFKKIEELKNEVAVVRSEVEGLKQQICDIEQLKKNLASTQGQVGELKQKVFSVAYQEERLPAAVLKLESCFMDPDHLPAAFKKDGHPLCGNCYCDLNGTQPAPTATSKTMPGMATGTDKPSD
jgi:regulator of replication initiation timing